MVYFFTKISYVNLYVRKKMVLIAPSILSADFSRLREEIIALEQAGADMIHVDVMDGHYVPNLTFGPQIVKAIKDCCSLPIDVHLMVSNPEDMIDWFANAGADNITVHVEACSHLDSVLQQIKKYGIKAGVSLNPSTSEQILTYVLDKLDMVLVMTVNPGFGGQTFIKEQLEKIAKIRDMRGNHNFMIEVDGGINALTGAECIAAGADILVAGTSVFANGDYKNNIKALR